MLLGRLLRQHAREVSSSRGKEPAAACIRGSPRPTSSCNTDPHGRFKIVLGSVASRCRLVWCGRWAGKSFLTGDMQEHLRCCPAALPPRVPCPPDQAPPSARGDEEAGRRNSLP